ncbi:MAG: hypothetical protein HQ481_15545, partial [Alphaproteobacteria bacterium]|nr:hypothetical protein [Alphaproteobacteria bacterium]
MIASQPVTPPTAPDSGDTAPLAAWEVARAVLARTLDGAAAVQAAIDGPMLAAGHDWLRKLSHGSSLSESDKAALVSIGKFLFWRHAGDIPTVVNTWSARPHTGLVLQRRGRNVVLRAIGAHHLQPLAISTRRLQAFEPGSTKAAAIATRLRAATAPGGDEPAALPAQRAWLDAFTGAAAGEPLLPPVAEASEDLLAGEIAPWIAAAQLPDDLAKIVRAQIATLHELARDSEAILANGMTVAPVAYDPIDRDIGAEAVAEPGKALIGGDGSATLLGHAGNDTLAAGGLDPAFDLTAAVGPGAPNRIHDVALVQALLAFVRLRGERGNQLFLAGLRPRRRAFKSFWAKPIDGVPSDGLFHGIALFNFGLDQDISDEHRDQLRRGGWHDDSRATLTPGGQLAPLRAAARKYGNNLRAIQGSRSVYLAEGTDHVEFMLAHLRQLDQEVMYRLRQAQKTFNDRLGASLFPHRVQQLRPKGAKPDAPLPPPRLVVDFLMNWMHPATNTFGHVSAQFGDFRKVDPDGFDVVMRERLNRDSPYEILPTQKVCLGSV